MEERTVNIQIKVHIQEINPPTDIQNTSFGLRRMQAKIMYWKELEEKCITL